LTACFHFSQGILGYDRYINADGDAEFNLVLMDYRESNNGKIFNRELLHSNQVKRAPQDYINELIIRILNPLIASRMQ